MKRQDRTQTWCCQRSGISESTREVLGASTMNDDVMKVEM
jgi:hypothetical protein